MAVPFSGEKKETKIYESLLGLDDAGGQTGKKRPQSAAERQRRHRAKKAQERIQEEADALAAQKAKKAAIKARKHVLQKPVFREHVGEIVSVAPRDLVNACLAAGECHTIRDS